MSFLFFTITFFFVSMASAFLVYLYFTLSGSAAQQPKSETKVKAEPAASDLGTPNPMTTSDTAQASGVRDGHLSLRASDDGLDQESREGRPRIKKEEDLADQSKDIQPLIGEADDEDEGYGESGSAWRDSGIGTSRDDQDRRDMQRRRKFSNRWEP